MNTFGARVRSTVAKLHRYGSTVRAGLGFWCGKEKPTECQTASVLLGGEEWLRFDFESCLFDVLLFS